MVRWIVNFNLHVMERAEGFSFKYEGWSMTRKIKRLQIQIPDDIVAISRALMPPLGQRAGLFEKMWQSLIAYSQFDNRDFIKAMLRYVQTKDRAYFVEAKAHIADCFCQMILLCAMYEFDVNEVIQLGYERMKVHLSNMQKEFKEYY